MAVYNSEEEIRNSKKSNQRLLVGLIILASILAALLAWMFLSSSRNSVSLPSRPIKVGDQVPNWTITMMDGKHIDMRDLRGSPVWLNFWASWCGPCRAEMPDIAIVGKKFEAKGGKLIAINVGESEGTIESYLETTGLQGVPVAMDSDGKIANALGIYTLPVHVFITPDGKVVDVHMGSLDAKAMEEELSKIQR